MKKLISELILLPFFALYCCLIRFKKRSIDIGIGPEPLINNLHHKKALKLYGYTAETFVSETYYITQDFDHDFSKKIPVPFRPLSRYFMFLFCVSRYRCLYFYFNGGPLKDSSQMLRKLEPFLLKLAKLETVVMPYGSDVTDTGTMSNLNYKFAMITQYPQFSRKRNIIRTQIARWCRHASYVFSGCDWVDYNYSWDKLLLAHFSIDTNEWKPHPPIPAQKNLRILHAPNHRWIKGTPSLISAVEQLKAEGFPIELILVEKKPNTEIKRMMAEVDVVVDQLVIGWYAMFALEAMSSGRPVICFIREDLKKLYQFSGLLETGLPLISANQSTIYDVLKDICNNRTQLQAISTRSRDFVVRHHSLKAIGYFFDEANRRIGILPSLSVTNQGSETHNL